MKKFMIAFGNFIFRWRDTIFTLIILVAFLMVGLTDLGGAGELLGFDKFKSDMLLTGVGAFLLALGQFTRIFTIGYAYIKRGGLKKQIFAENVVRRGVFAHTRNPMYLGNLLIVTGAIVAFNIAYYLPVLLLFYFIYACIIIAEENFLRGKFGAEYEDYLKTVPRLIPGGKAKWKESKEGMEFTWKRVLKKEHGSISLITGGLTIFTILKLVFRHGYIWQDPLIYGLWGLVGAIILFNMICSVLKRNGKLEWDPERP